MSPSVSKSQIEEVIEFLPELKNEILESFYNFDQVNIDNEIISFHSKIPITLKRTESINNETIGSQVKHDKHFDTEVEKGLSKLPKNAQPILIARLIENKSLQETGDSLGITRERVRQIEEASIKKVPVLFPKDLIMGIRELANQKGIIYRSDVPLENNKNIDLIFAIFSHKKFPKRLTYDVDYDALVLEFTHTFQQVKNRLQELLRSMDEAVCSIEEMQDYIKYLVGDFDAAFILNKMVESGELVHVDDDSLFMKSLFTRKRSRVEFIYSLFADGFETYKKVDKLREYLNEYFPNVFTESTDRAITGLASLSEKILLWEWGKHIHQKYVQDILENYDFSNLLEYLDNELETLLAVDLSSYFHQHEKALTEFGIPSEHALHTMLKLKYPEDYTYQDSPRVSLAGAERMELKKVLLDAMNENRTYSLDELMDILKSPSHRVQQLINRTDEIISVDTFTFIKRQYIDIANELLDEIVIFLNERVRQFHFLYVGLVIDNFRTQLNALSNYNIEVALLELLKKFNVEKDFQISNRRIVDKNYTITRNSLNFHYLLDQFMDDKNRISKNELFEYFYVRGLDSKLIMNYYMYSKLKLLARIDEETFVKLSSISLDEKRIHKINALVETHAGSEVRIDQLIEEIRDNLPNIDVDWNRYILSDILDRDLFKVIPSSENPQYIEVKSNGL